MARFDDLRSGTVLQFSSLRDEIVARTPQEVMPALAAVERATADGRWAFGFVAYEAAAGLDDALPVREPVPDLPLVWFGIADGPGPGADPEPATGTATGTGPAITTGAPARRAYAADRWELEWTEAQHAARVDAVRRAIADGETYQCNLTTRMTSRLEGDLLSFYRTLATNQRGAYNAYLDLGRFVVASASPECFFDWSGSTLTTVPMKGTAPRGLTAASDLQARGRLLASEKDRAENVMIVDLLRNDLSRVAEPGTVEVTDLLACEPYSTVWQLTSTVTGRVRPGTTLPDVFRALFPCGSVTGAPKARTMRLIDELESSPRGVYCGAIGYVAPAGSPTRARFGVAIRTVTVDRSSGTATYGVGGGVTWGSTAEGEYQEILTKASILDAPPEPDFGLLETFRLSSAGPVNLDQHLDRLATSARYFGFSYDRAAVVEAVARAAQGVGSHCLARVRLSRDGGVEVTTRDAAFSAEPVTVAVDTRTVDRGSRYLYHKTTVRHVYEEARRRHPGADDVLLVNGDGHVTESTVANLAARVDGAWVTPPVEDGCLPGVGRQLLLDDGVLTERSLTVEDLLAAEELALVSSARGWRTARLSVAPGGGGADAPHAMRG
ncbi:para-aminobenzoate synthetase/4-amino-4-deoxychorismate lyase [Georgenia soli]|uniref:Para-aminobenzoate synthetase/4-amino-4-deoxychorismate lyase n=1 Tax=Georgenia soli TaxID=638953 RepID=A0A2A9ERC9_9MICO|nr:para-aminobenzoate synthetase/4-amino-4-deoxychorismate lyase [Georgenia soli]